MSESSSNCWYDEISIRNDNIRFAFMFILFTLLASLTTTVLFIFAYDSYQLQSEMSQYHFTHYVILAAISLILFFLFFIGSLVYTSRSIRRLSYKSSTLSSKSNRSMSCECEIVKPSLLNIVNDKNIIKTKTIYYNHRQTEV